MTRHTGMILRVHCSMLGARVPDPVTAAKALEGSGTSVWYTPLSGLRHRMDDWAGTLDQVERDRADRFRFERDRERFIIGHGLLREILGKHLGVAPEQVIMRRGEFGKPYVPELPFHFNLSDTKDAVIIAISFEQEIGVDVETMERTVDHSAVSEHYFTEEEVGDISSSMDPKLRFLELWTRKEAVLKASGVGIMEDLRALRVNADLNTNRITHPDMVRLADPEYHLLTWHVKDSAHIISIAAHKPLGTVRFHTAG